MIQNFGRFASPVLMLPRLVKRGLVIAIDAALCILSAWVAFYLRLGEWLPFAGPVNNVAVTSIAVALPIFMVSGLYRAIFRYSGLPAMLAVWRASVLSGLAMVGIFTLHGVVDVPRTVGVIQPIILFLLVGASRAVARLWLGGLYQLQQRKASIPRALIYGAGSAGQQLASAMVNSSEIRVVGFLDDDERLQGNLLNGLPIHNPADLAKVLSATSITDVLLALPSASRLRRNEVLNELKHHKVAVRTLPGISDIATGKVSLSDVRELDIDDLLDRNEVEPSERMLSLNTYGKTVLVTGAGGSIGGELCRQILKCKPKQLLLVEMSEYALYQIHQKLITAVTEEQQSINESIEGLTNRLQGAAGVSDIEVIPLLASVCDEARMHEIMRTWRPHTVYHAAAYKHVPLVEHNPVEGIRNNVWGTLVCAQAAVRNSVCNFVLISTDKAVRPTNIMGATKRLAEMVLQALADRDAIMTSVQACKTPAADVVFSMVRFGNVLGSSGSVVPLFREQIKKGGPITLTHKEITRYFMTVTEAAQLVIQAGAMGTGGDVFVLDMGRPVKIIDLAYRLVELSGLTVRDELHPDGDIELAVTGLRPGEKLYEELLIGDNPEPTQHARIMKAHEQYLSWAELEGKLNALSDAMRSNDISGIRALLKNLVNGYQQSANVVDWVYLEREKMM